MMSKKTYCYVTTGILPFHTPISDVRLLTKKQLNNYDIAIRLTLPSDITLETLSCDNYSTTEDTRPVSDFEPVIYIKIDNKWTTRSDLNHISPCDVCTYLQQTEKLYITKQGFLSKENYIAYLDDLAKQYEESNANI